MLASNHLWSFVHFAAVDFVRPGQSSVSEMAFVNPQQKMAGHTSNCLESLCLSDIATMAFQSSSRS